VFSQVFGWEKYRAHFTVGKNPKHDCQSTWLFSQTSYAFAHVQDDAPLWRQGTPEVFESDT
jgi:hypothetical protein